MERRTFVRLAGLASIATTAGLAGCQGDGEDGENGDETTAGDDTPEGTAEGTPDSDETPDGTDDEEDDGPDDLGQVTPGEPAPYDSWVIPESVDANNELIVASLDVTALSQSEDLQGSDDEALNNDPLATTATGFLFVGLFATAALSNTGLGSITEEGSPTERLHLVGSAVVFEGPYDSASLGSDAAAAGLSEAGAYEGYTIYEGDSKSIAISDSAVVLANESTDGVGDATGRVQAHIDGAAGNKTLYSEQEQPFDDLINALPSRTVTGVAYSPDASPLDESSGDSSETNSFAGTGLDGNAHGLANSSDIAPGDMTSSLAIRYESASDVDDRATIESAVGTAADSRAVSIDGTLAVVEGEYSEVPSL